jgi:hypothetical protein
MLFGLFKKKAAPAVPVLQVFEKDGKFGVSSDPKLAVYSFTTKADAEAHLAEATAAGKNWN